MSIPGGNSLLAFRLLTHSTGIAHGLSAVAASKQHQLALLPLTASLYSQYPII